jgi:hypothetical protein
MAALAAQRIELHVVDAVNSERLHEWLDVGRDLIPSRGIRTRAPHPAEGWAAAAWTRAEMVESVGSTISALESWYTLATGGDRNGAASRRSDDDSQSTEWVWWMRRQDG